MKPSRLWNPGPLHLSEETAYFIHLCTGSICIPACMIQEQDKTLSVIRAVLAGACPVVGAISCLLAEWAHSPCWEPRDVALLAWIGTEGRKMYKPLEAIPG